MLDERFVEVAEYVPSDGRAADWERSETAFAELGRLHDALATVPVRVPLPDYSSYADPATALAALAETDDAFSSCAGHDGYDAALAVRDEAMPLLVRLRDERDRYVADLPRTLIHGDYRWGNVLFDGGEVVAILDFDFMAHRERVYELAYSLWYLLILLNPDRDGEGITGDELTRMGDLIACYNAAAASPTTPAEIHALPFEMARVPLYHIAEAGYLVNEPDSPNPIGQTLSAAPYLPLARWLIDNAARLQDVIVEASPRSVQVPSGQ